MTDDLTLTRMALDALRTPGLTIEAAATAVPSKPGLYAISASPDRWHALDLGQPPDTRPLYVGKSEDSLSSRDVRTHFATGKTGWSTVRRSLAALLTDTLELRGQPRTPSNPGNYSNFGLEPDGDQRLTDWMSTNLRLAVWASPPGTNLGRSETLVLAKLVPPLNLSKVRSPWKPQVDTGRRALAAEARAWTPPA
jgi:hypothetical protein